MDRKLRTASLFTVVALGWPTNAYAVQTAPAPGQSGNLVICNHSGYLFDVFADGPQTAHTADLAGSFDECTNWKPVRRGVYQIGFALRTPTQNKIAIEVRVRRDGQRFYKEFSGQGLFNARVSPGATTRVDLLIPRS